MPNPAAPSTTSPITLPDEDTEVPTRFLPEFDNLLLSHADRTRFIPTSTPRFLMETLSRGATLQDGHLTALWKLQNTAKNPPPWNRTSHP